MYEYIETKKLELSEREKQLDILIPEIQKIRKISKEEQEGTIYKGKKGLKSIFEDILKEKKPWFVFGATGQFKEIFHAYFMHFHEKRAKLKIPLNIIFSEKIRIEKRETQIKFINFKYLPESFITPSTTYIYGDKVAIIIWSGEPMAFLIRSNQVASSYKSFFDALWNIAKS